MTLTNILLGLLLVGVAYLAFRLSSQRKDDHDPELGRKNEEIGQLKSALQKERSEKDEQAGKGKELFARYKDIEAELKAIRHERDTLRDQVMEYKETETRRTKELRDQLTKLDEAKHSLDDEKLRVRREDEERQQRLLAERDRLWNEHEVKVIAALRDLCAKPEYAFSAFDNTNLPDGFDGSLKPDFMISFLGQYIVFDAKVSRSENFQNYIATNAKKTAAKYKGQREIYSTIFFVVPTEAIPELTKRVFTENGFTVYVISPESLEPILASLKKITTYELAEQLDPEERENIIRLIAKLDTHINVRNAFDVILAKMGAELLTDSGKIYPDLAREVMQEKQKIRIPSFKTSDIKRLVSGIEEREKEIAELTQPRAAIAQDV